jgi:hypothetical protein
MLPAKREVETILPRRLARRGRLFLLLLVQVKVVRVNKTWVRMLIVRRLLVNKLVMLR